MTYSPRFARLASWTLLAAVVTLAACDAKKDEEPAPITGRWNLVTQHSMYTDATSGATLQELNQPGAAGDYLNLSATTLNEYRADMLSFTMDYTRDGNTLTLQSPSPRINYSREIIELTGSKLVLRYKLPAIVMNQVVTINATYSR
ncbi:hypothetical protein LRS06_19830 [Hymenobacter sp. J193]|uniref:hypothetical protein n=1 Tax=Hymenobacter sp. J193 TaxID=2898429 RepID=UPI002150A071|nr:hypothetical protein [Hymenobacter sp. J193]MCR5889980.1 hypothetical protein [Hymenobacter sp. J193]